MPKTPERAAFGVFPQAGKRGQRKLTANEQLAQFLDERAMELPKFGDLDLEVPTAANRSMGSRMVERDVGLKRQADKDMSPLEKLAGGIQTGRLIGSGLTQAVKSIPTAITKGGKAAEDYIAENIYQPNQPKAYEYAGDVADFLTSLETDYKLPPVLPEAVAIQSLLGPATSQAGKAVKKGAKQGALNLMTPSTLNPQAGVIKMKGGNWLGGRLMGNMDENVKRLKPYTKAGDDGTFLQKELQRAKDRLEMLEADPYKIESMVAGQRQTIEDINKKIALNNWVTNNLGKYVKNQMATPEDPIRLLLDKRTKEIEAKHAKDLERAERVAQRAMDEPDPRRQANLIRESERLKMEANVERQFAMDSIIPSRMQDYSPEADYYLKQRRQEAGFPAEGMGESEAAKRYETLTDDAISTMRAGDVQETKKILAQAQDAERAFKNKQLEVAKRFDEHIRNSDLSEDQIRVLNEKTPIADKADMIQDREYGELGYAYNKLRTDIRRDEFAAAQENPFIDKLDPETQLYSGNTADMGFDHVIDILKQDVMEGRIRPEQLNKVSVEDAVRRTMEFDQEAARKMAEAQIKATEGFPTYKEYPEGYRWIELAMPEPKIPEGSVFEEYNGMQRLFGPDGESLSIGATKEEAIKLYKRQEREKQLEEALQYEGNTMGHCVGGYCPDVVSGKSRIFSLRDAKGEPHVTVEVNPSSQRVAPRHEEILAEMKASGLDISQLDEPAYDAAYEQALQRVKQNRPPAIAQIKGKQNAAPKAEYLPYVQDFVKSGKYSEVGDLRNTGLFRLGNEYMTEAEAAAKYKPMTEEALNFLETHPAFEQHRVADKAYSGFKGDPLAPEYREIERAAGAPVSPNVPYTYRELRALLSSPEDWTDRNGTIYDPISTALEKLNQAKKELGIDLPPPEGMAHGGRVHFSDNPDVMQLELAGGGLVKKAAKAAKAAAKPVKGTQDILPAAEREENLQKFLGNSRIRERMYHATPKDFKAFKPGGDDPTLSGPAIWVTPDATKQPAAHNIGGGSRGFVEGTNVMPVYVQARSPLMLDDKLSIEWARDVFADGSREFPDLISQKTIDELKSSGYDSIIHADPYGNRGGEQEILMFEPNKIKSAIGNRGTYDIEDPDITKAEGGEVRMAGGGALGKVSAKGAAKGAKEAAVPLSLPRVRPTTKDIFEAAERVGKQQAGEFVRSPLLTKTTNLAGRSKKEVDRLKEMEYKLTPIKDLPEMKPYEAKVGEVNIALPGDQTVSDMLLESVDGIPIGTTSEGGALFGRGRLADPEDKRAFWASNVGPAGAFQRKVTELARLYDTDMVTAYHLAMGQTANNFAQHIADANMRAIDFSKLDKKKMNLFDSEIANGFYKKDNKTGEVVWTQFPEWPGIANPDEALAAMKDNPELRKWFNDRMKTEGVTKKSDLPYGKSIEWAMTEPELRNMEINLTGLSAGRMKPGAELIPDSTHQTYSHDIPGTALGRAPELSPFEISFPDATSFVREKYRPQDFTGTIQKVFPHQVVDEAYLDDMYKYYTQLRKVRGFKKGGSVQKKEVQGSAPSQKNNEQRVQNPVHFTENPDVMRLALTKRN